jgi:hypothetical protein
MLARVSLDYRWKQERDLSHRGLYVELQADQTINDLLVEALGDRFDDPKAPFQPISQVVRLPRNVPTPQFSTQHHLKHSPNFVKQELYSINTNSPPATS